jgi:hypothetical protein
MRAISMHGFYNNDMAAAVTPREVAVNFGDNYHRLRASRRSGIPIISSN